MFLMLLISVEELKVLQKNVPSATNPPVYTQRTPMFRPVLSMICPLGTNSTPWLQTQTSNDEVKQEETNEGKRQGTREGHMHCVNGSPCPPLLVRRARFSCLRRKNNKQRQARGRGSKRRCVSAVFFFLYQVTT